MRILIPFVAVFSFALLTGCASTDATSTDSAAPMACASCAAKGGEKAACATCAAGEFCAECAGEEKKEACATCAAGLECAECAAKKDKSTSAAPATTTEPVATINAKGMGCPLCASSADRRLMKVDGVKWTNIDLGNGIVTVGLDPEKPAPSAESLQTAIRDAGFTAEEVTMPGGEVIQ